MQWTSKQDTYIHQKDAFQTEGTSDRNQAFTEKGSFKVSTVTESVIKTSSYSK